MKFKPLPSFDSLRIDLEIDFGERGGIQRFRTIGKVSEWLQEEKSFWAWLRDAQARNFVTQCSGLSRFWNYEGQVNQVLNAPRQKWDELKRRSDQLIDSEKEQDQLTVEFEGITKQVEGLKDQLKRGLENAFRTHVLPLGMRRLRTEPISQYISEMAEVNVEEAVYALDQTLLDQNNQNIKAREASGRLQAVLFEKNLNRKLRPDNRAFEEAVQTWSSELNEYKSDFDELKTSFDELVVANKKTESEWRERTDKMATEFTEQLDRNTQELENLKETYEAHMALSAPMKYWKTKRKSHSLALAQVKRWLVGVAVATVLLLGIAAWFLLPQTASSSDVPWRNLGLFVLGSTFCLWFVRLLVKLLLSNIHLRADADERVVMIQTFMAMVSHKESREGLKKEDIALVLAPIFKPSTTGVIKDDGGPVTLSDFIAKLGK